MESPWGRHGVAMWSPWSRYGVAIGGRHPASLGEDGQHEGWDGAGMSGRAEKYGRERLGSDGREKG